jgi:hypothetical protein
VDSGREDESTEVEDVIVVTAQRTESFSMGDTSEFDETIFDQVVSTSNPDLAGLAFLTPEERRDNGWAVSVPALGGRPGETGPFVSFEAGRGRLISGGILDSSYSPSHDERHVYFAVKKKPAGMVTVQRKMAKRKEQGKRLGDYHRASAEEIFTINDLTLR